MIQCWGDLKTLMAFSSSQLEAAIKEGRFEDVAPELDAEELQVRLESSDTSWPERV